MTLAPSARPLPAAILLLTLALAGCSGLGGDEGDGSDVGETTISIRFGGRATDIESTVRSDFNSRPSQADYDDAGFEHADFYTVHDQLADWAEQTGHTYNASAFSGTFTGFFLEDINGVEGESSGYWYFERNDIAGSKGMSDQVVNDGDHVEWLYSSGSSDGGSLGLAVDPVAPTDAEALRLSGSVAGNARVSVEARRGADAFFQSSVEATGAWSLDVTALPYGHSEVTVTADDGTATQTVKVQAVRLAPFTFEVQYGGYPGPTDSETAVALDLDAFVSLPEYEGRPAPHPDFANVHDLTRQWATQTAAVLELAYSESLQGYSVSKINGAGSPLDSSLPPYWLLQVNGETADFGMTLQPIAPGDHVAWCLNACV